ncbi:hypothetical protein HPP92_002651 [Vanilla planifolia]|uniref:Protein N-terminal asparagine amidohydrolase n=1 Tax=Vanilla planifolia TaxID=51239 RepID=A0A835RSY3_VANPL|nr:hypothetical protein HPP92_002651 [Vanilla planifolia]
MDHERVVDMGLSQMLAFVVDNNVDATLDVHLIGSFEDVPYEPRRHLNYSGYSVPLCSKIIEALQNRQEKFQVQTFCVLSHNTKKDLNGSSMPIITGFLVETSTGTIMPACFNKSTRCPDEIVRRIRISVSREDPCWEMKLLETYDTFLDRFVIAPCSWMLEWENRALSLQQLSDSKILKLCSTSPTAEAPDFVENLRRVWNYLMRYPHWEQSFTGRKPRIFERTITGGWSRCK